MYKTGHWGSALLVYAPVGGVLLAGGWRGAALVGGAVVLALARVPDYDQRIPFVSHRGPTHTLGFAVLVALATGAAGLALAGTLAPGRRLVVGAFCALAGLLSILSHLLADALTPAGIRPFWPVSSRSYSLDLVRADSALGNYMVLSLGVFVTAALVAAL
ncbi:metal-dependent hydrolase [Halobacteriales archaeon QS_4_69_31]|nr:MAG: metal-dependent hydrolase [Halobacteriales archaeon QS_4_69_31]